MKVLMVVPTYNEQLVIAKNIKTAYTALAVLLKDHDWTLLVADNGSTDTTPGVVSALLAGCPRLAFWHTDKKGRGNALRQVWMQADADVVAYMDADLAADLAEVPKLIAALRDADLAVGSRLSRGSSTDRSFFRECISRSYNLLSEILVGTSVSDLQCGFKAVKREVAQKILPLTTHDGWFFDTELIVFAEHLGFKVAELPVAWQESPDRRRKSSVKVFSTIWDDLVSLWKLRRRIKRF